MKRLKDKILYCLEKYPESRNSDTKLTNAIWVEFYSEHLFKENGQWAVKLTEIYELPKHGDVKRVRAIIQNKEKMFLPTDLEIRKQRNILEEEYFNYVVHGAEFKIK